MMSVDYKFHGWMGLNKDAAAGKMEWQEYEPKTWTEDDVDIKVTHCGVCGSDIHTLRSGWVSCKANEIHIVLICSAGSNLIPVLCWARSSWYRSKGWQEPQPHQTR